MSMQARRLAVALFSCLLAVLIAGCSGKSNQKSADHRPSPQKYAGVAGGTFPVAPEIASNVDFWRHVYGEWSRNQVAIHDDFYLGAIYEVSALPAGDQHVVRAKKAWYASRLKDLERKVRSGQSLSRDERALQQKLVAAGGTRALYGASERVRAQRGIREKFRRGLEISGRYDDAFRKVFRSRGLPEDLAYLPHVESSFQVSARSSVGAAGVWQFMPATGRVYGMTVNHAVDDRLDPVVAAEGAASYLGSAYRKLGSWPLAITSYNHGQGGMAKARAIYGNNFGAIATRYQGPSFKFDSRNFYAQFVAAREVASNPRRYFPEGVRYEAPISHDRLILPASMPAHHVASRYGVSTQHLAGLNRHLRDRALSGSASLPAGTTVWLPDGTLDRVKGRPYAEPAMIARAEPRTRPTASMAEGLAQAEIKPRPKAVVEIEPKALYETQIASAGTNARPEPKVVRAEPKPRAAAKSKPAAEQMVASVNPKSKTGAKAKPAEEPKVARAEPKPKAQAKSKAAAEQKVASVKPKTKAKAKSAEEPKVARVEPKAKAKSKPAAEPKVVRSEPAPKVQSKGKTKPAEEPKVARSEPAGKSKTTKAVGQHVVKPNETLYRVATNHGISVDQLKKLNKLKPDDNTIRPGQKLRVGS